MKDLPIDMRPRWGFNFIREAVISFCVAVGCLFNQSAEAIDNLRIPDLRTLSLGGSPTETPLFNPSLLAFQTGSRLYVNYYNRYSVSELATVSGGCYYINNVIPVGFEITSFGYDEYRESMFRLSLGKQLAERWALGVALQYCLLQSELFEESSGRITSDIGLTYKATDEVMLAVSMLHLPSMKVGDKNIDNEHIAAYSFLLGLKWDITSVAMVTGSVEHCKETPLAGSFGFEYMPFDDFGIRAGLRTSPLRPSLGIGYRLGEIKADIGILYHSVLGVSMGVGLSYSF